METPYRVYPEFVMRIPVYSFDKMVKIKSKALDHFRDNSFFRKAILLASPDLYHRANAAQTEVWSEAKTDKINLALSKYLTRMGSRCTPFGLFAGFCHGNFGETSQITFHKTNKLQPHSRLDMQLLSLIAEELMQNKNLRSSIRYRPNSSLFKIGDDFRYIEYKYQDNQRKYRISSIESTPAIESIINITKQSLCYGDIITHLMDEGHLKRKSQLFLQKLITNQLLTNSLEPTVTGTPFSTLLISTNKNHHIEKLNKLAKCETLLAESDGNPKADPTNDLLKVFDMLTSETSTNYSPRNLVQTDLEYNMAQCTLNKRIMSQLEEVVHLFATHSPKKEDEKLAAFVERYLLRYESEELPLSLVLDTESGIPYPADALNGKDGPMLKDIDIYASNEIIPPASPTPFHDILLQKLALWNHETGEQIEITAQDLTPVKNQPIIPSIISGLIQILSYNRETNKYKILFRYAGGTGGTNLIGRMSSSSKKVEQMAKNIVAMEQQSELKKIFAEIVHLPEARTGNILMRPILREYEIPYLAQSSLPLNQQIEVSDIMISIQNRNVVLRSKRLNKEIIPRLSTAHNFTLGSLPIYHFLCDVQSQHTNRRMGFSWESMEHHYLHLPRVVFKDVVLIPEQWRIMGTSLALLKKIATAKNPNSQFHEFTLWKNKFHIKDQILLCNFDNELYLNLSKPHDVHLFLSSVTTKTKIFIKEFLFDITQPLVGKPTESYTNEITVVFYKSDMISDE